MSDGLHFTIHYTPIEDGWWMAQVEEVRGALSQGETREQAHVTTCLTLFAWRSATTRRAILTASRSRYSCVKRRDLERHLRADGATLKNEGANHAKWISANGCSIVPRHNEIKPSTVRAICRQLNIPAPVNPNLRPGDVLADAAEWAARLLGPLGKNDAIARA